MKQGMTAYGPREWSEAQDRAATYLRALQGGLGAEQRQLLSQALRMALAERATAPATHPVTLLMEALFALLAEAEPTEPVPMAPPMQRVTMLPEPTEFPLHDGIKRVFRTRHLLFAGAR